MSGNNSNSRRDFLKGSLAVGAGAALAGSLNPRMAHAAGSDVIKLALVGAGGRGSGPDCGDRSVI